MLYLPAVQCSASRIACTLNIDHPWDSGQVLFCHRHSSHCCDCGSGYSRRTALIILHYETDHFDLMMRPAFSASFDWLGGVSVGVPSWLFCDFPCPRCCKSCKKLAIFATTFATMVAKRPLNTPRLSNISRIFPWYIVRVFSSYGFLRSFCNNGCKTMVTCTYLQYLQQFLQPRLSYRHTCQKTTKTKKHGTSAP